MHAEAICLHYGDFVQANFNMADKTTDNTQEGTIHNEPMYEDVVGPLPSVNVINTQANVAYGHAQTITTT